jgi:serine/threonine protein kinase
MQGLSIGRPRSPAENVPINTPARNNANNLGPRSDANVLENMFPDPKYRSHVFFIKRLGEVFGIRKVAFRKDGEIFSSTMNELRVYKKLIEHRGWQNYVLPFREGRLLDHGKTVYIDFDYVEGMDLIDFSKRATPADKNTILSQVAAALSFCFTAGVTHGDIKPDNIYITTAGKVLLFDFGEATRDPRQRNQEDDLQAYLALCKALTGKVPDVDTNLDKRELTDIYADLERFWSSQRGGGRTRRARRARRTRNKRV